MTDSLTIANEKAELKKTASGIVEERILVIIRENYNYDVPLDKNTAIKIVSNKFRLDKRDARRILLALDKTGAIRFGKRRVFVFKEGEHD